MVTILIILFVLAISWSESSSATIFCINEIVSGKALVRLCRCTGSSEPSLLTDVKLKSKIMIVDFLQSKLKGIKLFQ